MELRKAGSGVASTDNHGLWKGSARILDGQLTHVVRGAYHGFWRLQVRCVALLRVLWGSDAGDVDGLVAKHVTDESLSD